eukprot:jgi/Tetstr1/463699/TSEL_008558.t1
MGDPSAAEERIYEEREDARTIAGGLRKETTPRHERFDGATSIWTEWFNSFNANVLVPYALTKAPPRSAPRADGAGSSEGESTGPERTLYAINNELSASTLHPDALECHRASEDADELHEFRYRRYVELFETKFNEAPKMRTRYDGYTREGFRETPASLAMTLREPKAHLPDFTWDKVNQKAFDVMTSVWRSIPALKQSLDASFNLLKDIAVLRQSHEDRLDELRRRVDVTSFTEPTTENVPTSSAQPCMSTTPPVAVAAVEAAEAQAEVAVVVMAVDAAMEAHPEADEDRAGTLDLEAMFSRILEKSQAAHGATSAMRLAVEMPDPFLDCVDTDDHGTLLHGASCVELPVRSARNPELRMRQPGWDAQREQLTKQRPQGFEPAVEQEAPASYEGHRGGGAITSDMLDIRNRQLLQHLRTALQYAKFLVYPLLCGVHQRVVDRMKPGEADATLQSMSMQGIGGKMEMQRLVGRISYVINPDTDWERKFEWPLFAILEGDHLPYVIFRIELQPDNVGTDAAVQPEQQEDDAELPELVADSDDEEDFVPCWVEEVPDHVVVIASCFTLRASPMDADSDSDEELPGMVEDSTDDDDVYDELPDMT